MKKNTEKNIYIFIYMNIYLKGKNLEKNTYMEIYKGKITYILEGVYIYKNIRIHIYIYIYITESL